MTSRIPRRPLAGALSLAIATTLAACASAPAGQQSPAPATSSAMSPQTTNPFFAESSLELRYPHFDKIKDSDFAPAFDQGMAEQLKEVEAIADNPQPPTFENTIVAMEKSGKTLDRATAVFFNLNGTDTNDARKKLQSDYAPKFSAHGDAIRLNPKLFARIKALYDQRATLGLDAESLRLLERYHDDFVRAGAALDDAQKTRMKAINSRMAALGTQFSQNVLAEVNDSAVVVETREELAGLTDAQIDAAAAAAKSRNMAGKYVITLLNTTGQPPLSQLENRALRERIHKASVNRGSRGNRWDNTGIVAEMTRLRAERAAMLGYPDFASFSLANQTAANKEAVNRMLAQLAPAAVANARREGAELQKMIDAEQKAKGQPSFELAPWDWDFYSEKVRKAKYDFDEAQLKPYLEMKNVLENGVFFAANQFYGISFKERGDLPKYHPDTWTYDVFDRDGSKLAIFIFDPYARESKRGGAWMNSYVRQSRLEGTQPVVANHQNITKPPAGQPTLLTWDEVNTMFHEFGHALHGMFSNVRYPYFSGTSVPRDFVEFPSQVNEMWADWPSILANYAKHHQTGAPMPAELLKKVEAAAKFNEGFRTTEYLGSALLDQRWHQVPAERLPQASGVMAYEAKALKDVGLDYAAVPPRYRTPYFSHIMGGYAAGYYAYIWSEVLDANTVKWIRENGGLTRANGDRLRERLLSQGGSKDAMVLFRDFTGGKNPDIQPLLERRGLSAPTQPATP
ncbi:M3 family peptidase [Lysobacter pythonis]|uniref:Dipeptidyl carboxypeptidase n=1 Tax=Solilutibacter pythonis TaxID=2483112 RepID=A0A3M2HMD3_9GAMM|nr:M3 family metallopeptidase [Lysobacter pythonis]RMH90876.1 M3 family peptidase [Lysobacter pythonis]